LGDYTDAMNDHVMLWAVGLCTAAFVTAIGARVLDRICPDWPLSRRLFVASFATPFGWVVFQAIILPIVAPDPKAHAGLLRQWPLYLQDVVLTPALGLWVCGLFCAAVLAYFHTRSRKDHGTTTRGQRWLLRLSGACAAGILLPMAMEVWIDTGQISGRFALLVLISAFFAGLMPVIAASWILRRVTGATGVRRFGEPVVALYAITIAWRGYVWHDGAASRPGASAITAVEICALGGVFLGWLAIHRDIRASAFDRIEAARDRRQ
jgi:hypothetical protein